MSQNEFQTEVLSLLRQIADNTDPVKQAERKAAADQATAEKKQLYARIAAFRAEDAYLHGRRIGG